MDHFDNKVNTDISIDVGVVTIIPNESVFEISDTTFTELGLE